MKKVALFFLGLFFSIAFAQQPAMVENQKISVPEKISGRYITSDGHYSGSFSLENISVSGEDISAKLTVWFPTNPTCNVRSKEINGVIENNIATFKFASPCASDYVSIFDFEKKIGSYTRAGGGGKYKF